MSSVLPEAFLDKMQQLLGEEYPAFMASYEKPRYYGLRVNTNKVSLAAFSKYNPFTLSPIPWAPEGFYYQEEDRPGKHPYYHAGLYYIQEPSAMMPVELLGVVPGDRVLDLCAAPGGKSTQIASKLQGLGLLAANDNAGERVKALAKNLELAGVSNAIVLNEWPASLVRSFPSFFDKILIDAPCSGEGMFRKDEEMAKQWEKHSVEKCVLMQRDILAHAAALLAPGGRIVYSTCTFSPEENEGMIAEFLSGHPDFRVAVIPASLGLAPGRADWLAPSGRYTPESAAQVAAAGRIWPHLMQGEGHFFAVLEHSGSTGEAAPADEDAGGALRRARAQPRGRKGGGGWKQAADETELTREEAEQVERFMRLTLTRPLPGKLMKYGSHVYLQPPGVPRLDTLKVIRPGWFIGTLKKNRFEPSHPLALGLKADEAVRRVDLPSTEPEAIRYLKGETLEISASLILTALDPKPDEEGWTKGYCLVCVDGFPLGWGKWRDGMLKNEYPAGWRWT
ncbi:RsmF rRNA methyltransferase first C-terminal domain-containing protein [Paenibacillus gansuensis]|uniref:RsmF rRNA methyltransferase first C-terminal domain-containing protein n=1 Tax=Paenibacillus gansuensis TaxID=306542 RepID=A0ABW5PDJ8_9BACL